ncbi:MAG: AzlD domain-containing protein [Tissierellia bacterium]|nr:AzlD domain-containing protein [Tissierellia bacterium]
MNQREVLITIAIVGLVSGALRFLPLFLFGKRRELPQILVDLGEILPYSMMAFLVVYGIKDISFSAPGGWLPYGLAMAITAASYKLFKQLIFSIVLGTAAYMILIQYIFV